MFLSCAHFPFLFLSMSSGEGYKGDLWEDKMEIVSAVINTERRHLQKWTSLYAVTVNGGVGGTPFFHQLP